MSITYGFFNAIQTSDGTYDRTYTSEQISDMFEGLISDGVYESVGDAFIVTAKSGLTVEVGSGRMVIGNKWVKNDTKFDITLAAAHLTLPRYSAIIARVDQSNRIAEIVEVAGTPASNPLKPDITNNSTVHEKCLAYIYVPAGASTISQGHIQDTRADSTICGWVTGIVQQVDTSKLFLQWQTAYEEFYEKIQADWDEWFAALSGQLQVNTYIKKYHKIVDLKSGNGVFLLDMDGYTYDENDIFLINVNGIMLTETYDYLLNTSTSPVEIHTNATLEADNVLEITVLKSKIGQA